MAIETTIGGVRAGLETPLLLVALPIAVVALGYLLFRRSEVGEAGERPGRRRLLLFGSRLLIVTLLVVAAAGPYTVTAKETPGEPRVTMLIDRSESMGVASAPAEELATRIEDAGVPVTTRAIASGNESRIGEAVISSIEEDGSVLLVSDGQVTGGSSLGEAAELAAGVNATINAVNLTVDGTDRYVSLHGPAKTSVGVRNAFLARVRGVNANGTTASLSITVDGSEVAAREVTGHGEVTVNHTFETTGNHRIAARLDGTDRLGTNDVFYKTVRVVEPPKLLYVSRSSYPFEQFLSELYDVTTADEVPGSLEPYHAVVIQDVAASDLGNVDALQRYVIGGNGLVVAGGRNSFERGDYGSSPIADMLPVRVGAGGRGSTIVLVIDISGSTSGTMSVQKAIALDVLDQLGDGNTVGVVAFNDQAYQVTRLSPLGTSRAQIRDTIRRLQSGRGTLLATGLRGAAQLLGGRGGNVILITDGIDQGSQPVATAQQLGSQGTGVITVGVGDPVNEGLLREIADVSDGTYFRADETNRLRILFGDESRQFQGSGLTIVDSNHFITTGVELSASPGQTNTVSVKDGAQHLVAGASGTPALAAWRYGLGRVVSLTAYGGNGGLDGLLSRPDSLVLSKSVNWAVGDPERKATGIVDVRDTRVGRPTTVAVRGESRPSASGVRFSKTGENQFRATVVPTEPGYRSVLDAEYAVNYPREFEGFGLSSELQGAVRATGGRIFEADQATQIARSVRRHATRVREVREEWDWLLLVAALVIYLSEVMARRVQEIYGTPTQTVTN